LTITSKQSDCAIQVLLFSDSVSSRSFSSSQNEKAIPQRENYESDHLNFSKKFYADSGITLF